MKSSTYTSVSLKLLYPPTEDVEIYFVNFKDKCIWCVIFQTKLLTYVPSEMAFECPSLSVCRSDKRPHVLTVNHTLG